MPGLFNVFNKFKGKGKEKQEAKSSYLKFIKSLKEAIPPKNVNTLPDDHIQIINGRKLYARTLYVADMPRRSTFAYTFEPILKFGRANVSVFVRPIRDGKAITELNNVIVDLDAERMMAESKDINRTRKLSRLFAEAESLAEAIDSGENALYDVALLITLHAKSYEELNKMTDDLINKAKERSIILTIPYANQEKAFLSNLPVNRNQLGADYPYWHRMDKYSLATLFHYTKGKFGHRKGAVLGRNMDTGELVSYNIFESKMNGYNMIICGMTRSGKSTTVKILALRSCRPNGLSFMSLDAEGEYGRTAEALGGLNIIISNDSGIIVNPFELDIEYRRDESTMQEIPYLNLIEKVATVTYNIQTMARGTDPENARVNEITRGIIMDAVKRAYESKHIYHDKVESLFEKDRNGNTTKKALPTLGEWYAILESEDFKNKYGNGSHKEEYDYLLMVMADYIRSKGGTRLYFDGQSKYPQLQAGIPFINFDIHHLHEKYERPIAQSILIDWMWETVFKKNSEDPLKAKQIVAFFDETHYLLPYKEARTSLTNFYRRAAKKNVSVLTATQNLNDYMMYPDSHAIFTNSATKILLKHDKQERAALLELMHCTEAEADAILAADKGQTYVMSGNSKAFVKIDILPSEREIIETDMNIRKQIAQEKLQNRMAG